VTRIDQYERRRLPSW